MPYKIVYLPRSAVESLNTYLCDGGAQGRVPLKAKLHRCRESAWRRYQLARKERSDDRFLLALDLAASLRKYST